MNQILSRQDIVHNQVETFGYDGLNRLTSIGSRQIAYASNGNVTAIDGAGVQVHDYSASYSAFDRPVTLSEDNQLATLTYDAGHDRVRMAAYADSDLILIRYYIGRGFTGHEHLPWFGLINMNARLYDPLLGRFLAPDPFVQDPDFTQNFNRYS